MSDVECEGVVRPKIPEHDYTGGNHLGQVKIDLVPLIQQVYYTVVES